MQANAVPLGLIFANHYHTVIPLFQRPYVWNQDRNWEPLWDDIRAAAEEVEAAVDNPSFHHGNTQRTYFLGAVVTQQGMKKPGQLYRQNVIDGQQRLTTLQVLFAAARAVAVSLGATTVAASIGTLIENPREVIHQDYPNDRYKLWPLPLDRPAYIWAVSAGPDENPPTASASHQLVRARIWFQATIAEWANNSGRPETRLYHLFDTLKDRMQLVQIALEAGDDPQVIFEVLNHRGTPLDAADLVKNHLFQQLELSGQSKLAEDLLNDVWADLDAPVPWRTEETAGRVRRKRIDLLLMYWLVMQRQKEVLVDHLFSDFKDWFGSNKIDAETTIRSIRHAANAMETLRALPLSHPTGRLLDMMQATQITTPWPILLAVAMRHDVPESQRRRASEVIESFMVRRGICRWSTKDYNSLFITVLQRIQRAEGESVGDVVANTLLEQTADSRRWPTDREFEDAMSVPNFYHMVVRARLRGFLIGLERALRDPKTEAGFERSISDGTLHIEHILPQSWQSKWPLPLRKSDPGYAEFLERRDRAVHSLGNLTLLTDKLNPTVGNSAWKVKSKMIQEHSILKITTNSVFLPPAVPDASSIANWTDAWDEDRIALRGEWLRRLAIRTWPR